MAGKHKFYDDEVLRKIQKVETAMLKEYIKVCEENSLTYFIAYGSALGAVRHKGFIPWDDDIDIFMPRKDYEKFSEIVTNGELNKRYELISAANSDDFLIPEAHLQLRGTKFVDAPSLHYKKPIGIFLDLFILDNLADDLKERKKQERDCFFWCKMLIIRALPRPIVPFGGLIGKLASVILFVLHYIFAAVHLSPRWLYRKFTEASTRFNGVNTEYVTNFREPQMEETKMKYEDIFPLRDIQFEDLTVKVNNHVELSLINYFGDDYMQPPAVEKQHNHCPEVLDFGTSLEDFGIE